MISTIMRSKLVSSSAARPLALPSAAATLNPHPFSPRGNRETDMPVIIDHENATHCGLPRRFRHALGNRRHRNDQRQTAPAMPRSWPVARRFALRISALFSFPPQIDRPVCPPGCIGLLAQLTSGPAGKYSERHPARRALADARPFELPPSSRQTAGGIASAQSPETDPVAGTFQCACPHLEDVEMIKAIGVRRNAGRIAPGT
jgi:hypothetical protein